MDTAPDTQVIFDPFAKQDEFIQAVMSGDYRYLLFGGAIAGGKTYCILALLFAFCRIWPGSRWAITRKDLPTLRRNLLPSFERLRPRPFVGDIHRSEWTSRCANGSEIVFFTESIKDDPELNRWKGLEVNGFFHEEMNEISEAAFNKSIERAGRWKVDGPSQPPPLIIGTCNPSKNWVKSKFYDPWKQGTLAAPFFYLPSRIDDNPHLTDEYRKSLMNMPEAERKRFVEGNWDAAEEPDQLIRYEWIHAAKGVEHVPGRARLGVDVARYGNDDSVLAKMDGNRFAGIDRYHGMSTDRLADMVKIKAASDSIDAEQIRVDSVGVGAGVVDALKRDGYEVKSIESGSRAEEDLETSFRFNNLRSAMWWDIREQFRTGRLCADNLEPRLVEDLTAPRYTVSGDKVLKVESKDEIKKRIGRSTDAGDAFVYAATNVKLEQGWFLV